jgi:hypothetical protein
MEPTMNESQVFSPEAFSLSPVDLLPSDDDGDDDRFSDLDAREARYHRLGKLVDVEDAMEMLCARLRESPQLYAFLQDLLDCPIDPENARVHPMDALRLANEVAVIGTTVCDELMGMLDVGPGGGKVR